MRARSSFLLAGLSGVLLLLSLPPFKFGGVLAWFAFVPLLLAIYYQAVLKRRDRLVSVATVGGFLFLVWLPWLFADYIKIITMFWPEAPITVFRVIIFVLGIPYILYSTKDVYGGYIDTWGFWKPKHFPSKDLQYLPLGLQLVVLPLVWTACEFLFMNIPGLMRIGQFVGFFTLAKTQYWNPPIMQLASFAGIYGITFLILLVNCAITYAIIRYREAKRIFTPAIAIVCVVLAFFFYGLATIPAETEGDVTVAVIQVPPAEGQDTSTLYANLSETALKYDPQIIVWPGIMFDEFSFNPLFVDRFVDFSSKHNVYLTGWMGEMEKMEFGYGVVSPDGSIAMDNFGYHFASIPNYIMNRDVKGLFFPQVHSLPAGLGRIGVLDCMESGGTLPARHRIKEGAQLLIVPTGGPNNYLFSWGLGTNAIYRAVENRMFAIEVIGDDDSSLIVDPYGRIVKDTAKEPEIVVGKVSFTDQRTLYTKFGEVFGWTVVVLAAAVVSYNFYLDRKSSFKVCTNKNCMAEISQDAKTCDKCGAKQRKGRIWRKILWVIFKP
ncbi:MAG TPA: hypothetical protein VMW00_01340 [Dehalococcoidales bacterium]|nr:hypothetical protein [Dehalococcoidales bacterium]